MEDQRIVSGMPSIDDVQEGSLRPHHMSERQNFDYARFALTLQVPFFSNFPLINISYNTQNVDYQQKHKIHILKKHKKIRSHNLCENGFFQP